MLGLLGLELKIYSHFLFFFFKEKLECKECRAGRLKAMGSFLLTVTFLEAAIAVLVETSLKIFGIFFHIPPNKLNMCDFSLR